MFISTGSSLLITLLIKYSMICDYFGHWGFRFGIFSSIAIFFLQSNFRVLVIHWLGIHLVIGGKLLDNRDPEQPISSFWDSM